MWSVFSINSLAEILVIGDEYPILGECFLDNVAVGHPTRFFIHREDVVFMLP